jgi:hypothetical protein
MKCLALVAIVIYGLAQQPAKTPVPDRTTTPVQNEAISHTDQKPSGEDLKVQRQLARFTGLLVVVGFLQLIALIGQACLFFRQARIMGQHRVSLEQLAEAASDNAKAAKDGAEVASKNAEFSKLNARATEKAAAAANTSAEAAKRGVEIVISKERARVSVSDPDNLVLLIFRSTLYQLQDSILWINCGLHFGIGSECRCEPVSGFIARRDFVSTVYL